MGAGCPPRAAAGPRAKGVAYLRFTTPMPGGRGRVDFQLAVRFTQGATVGKTPVYCMKMAKCAQYACYL